MHSDLEIRPLQSAADAIAFRELNEEWIARYFTLEPMDRQLLNDPENEIVAKGGYIFLAHLRDQAAGCAALIPMHGGVFELSKMAVRPEFRGAGIGRKLLHHTIAHARAIGAQSIFLGTSTKLKGAIHLYESAGFRHLSPEEVPPTHYARTDVFMTLEL